MFGLHLAVLATRLAGWRVGGFLSMIDRGGVGRNSLLVGQWTQGRLAVMNNSTYCGKVEAAIQV